MGLPRVLFETSPRAPLSTDLTAIVESLWVGYIRKTCAELNAAALQHRIHSSRPYTPIKRKVTLEQQRLEEAKRWRMLMDAKFMKRVTRYQRRRTARLRAATYCVRRSLYARAVYSIQAEPSALSGEEDAVATLKDLRHHEVRHDVQTAHERRGDAFQGLWETQEVQDELPLIWKAASAEMDVAADAGANSSQGLPDGMGHVDDGVRDPDEESLRVSIRFLAVKGGFQICTLVVYTGVLALLQAWSIPACFSILVAYTAARGASALLPRAHGGCCRLATTVAVALSTSVVASAAEGCVAGLTTAVLPQPWL